MYKLYLFEQVELITEGMIEKILPLLPKERKEKALKYQQSIDRNNCVITYLILRVALKECFQITEFTLGYGRYGKPYLVEYPDIYFNISHCRMGCLVGVGDCPIGVDIQDGSCFSWEIANRVCCKEELELLKSSGDRNRDFIRMWAIKESYIKMLGQSIGQGIMEINTFEKKFIQVIELKKCIIAISCMP